MTHSQQLSSSSRVPPLTLAALLGIQITFAFNYLFSKVVMESVPPVLWGFLRTLCTALILFTYLSFKGTLRVEKAWALRKELLIFSFLGVVLNQASFLAGLQLTTTANSGLINAMIPVFTVLWVSLFKKEDFSLINWIGFILAFSGVLILQDLSKFSLVAANNRGDALTLLNAFSYSFFLFLSTPFFKSESPLWTTAWLFVFGSFGLGVLSVPQWSSFDPSTFSQTTIVFSLLGIFVGNLAPYLLISYVLRHTASSIVAQFVYLQALIAGLLGYFFLGESFSSRTLIAGAIMFSGLYLSLKRKG
jgi:drug/metabolite transporter (DMT)-like permease